MTSIGHASRLVQALGTITNYHLSLETPCCATGGWTKDVRQGMDGGEELRMFIESVEGVVVYIHKESGGTLEGC